MGSSQAQTEPIWKNRLPENLLLYVKIHLQTSDIMTASVLKDIILQITGL